MKEIYILLFIVLTIIIYFCYIQKNIENYIGKNPAVLAAQRVLDKQEQLQAAATGQSVCAACESSKITDSGAPGQWTKLSDSIKTKYSALVKDLCDGVILPDGWGCYKKSMDFTNTDWITDNSKNEFYIYNPRKNKVIYFNSIPDLNQTLANLESNNPIVKNRVNIPNIKWPRELIDPDTMGRITICNDDQYNDFLTKKNSNEKYVIALP
jgi:hypothetical protein